MGNLVRAELREAIWAAKSGQMNPLADFLRSCCGLSLAESRLIAHYIEHDHGKADEKGRADEPARPSGGTIGRRRDESRTS